MTEFAKQVLHGLGFKDQGVNSYTKTIVAYDRPMMVSINGQQTIRGGQAHEVVFEVEHICTGHIEPPQEDIEWFRFALKVDGETLYDEQEGFYNEDTQLFTNFCNHLFNTH